MISLLTVPILIVLSYRTWACNIRAGLPYWRNGLGLGGIVFVSAAWLWWVLRVSGLVAPVHDSFLLPLCEAVIAVGTLIAPGLALAWRGYPRVLAVVASILLLVGGQAFAYRSRMSALAWHILHGNSVTVAGYRIHVPSDWFAEQATANDAQLWNTKTGESIWFHTSAKRPGFTPESWVDAVQKLHGNELALTGRRDLNITGESYVCLEQDYEIKLPPSASTKRGKEAIHLPSVECRSAGVLDATFYGGMYGAPRQDYQDFYRVMASIQK